MPRRPRDEEILRLIASQGEAKVQDLAQATGLDPSTVRRALVRLEARGLVERTRGKVALFQAVRYVGELGRNIALNPETKRRIALEALTKIQPGMRIGISGGSTCTLFARLLRGMPLEVVTNAVNVAVELYSYPKTRVYLLPGELNLFSYEVVGEATLRAAEALPHLDALFVGATCIGPQGFFMRDLPETRVAQALKKRAQKTYVLAERRKWGCTTLAFFASLEEAEWINEEG